MQLAEEGVLHGLGGVVDEIGERALEGFGIGEDERKAGREAGAYADAAQAAGKESECVVDDGIEIGGARLRGGELSERGELVNQRAHGLYR